MATASGCGTNVREFGAEYALDQILDSLGDLEECEYEVSDNGATILLDGTLYSFNNSEFEFVATGLGRRGITMVRGITEEINPNKLVDNMFEGVEDLDSLTPGQRFPISEESTAADLFKFFTKPR